MLCIGFAASGKEIAGAISHKTKMLQTLIANVLIPLMIAVLLIALIPMPDAMATVLLLLAFAPGRINAIQF